ncbi:hypothetical protein L211DRAFT_865640 [Terfezia boudieri ATCC MYA-4762]|uniref:Uncharacterized protein n=1 Tax=Terfezia boudieri ATCC MYA-4762 TaxID=1051890 RepID=A0A3N4ME60_9PEZI|nr:hypothetical protein L211DRAFT_865640 [Terfezia boudieri ATCC MYA-4762]
MAYVDIDQEDIPDTNKNYVSPTHPFCHAMDQILTSKYRYSKTRRQRVTKTCTITLRVPTTIWQTQKFSIRTTLTKAPTATVSSSTTVTVTKTHIEREIETVFKVCTNEPVTNVGTGPVTQVVTETVHVTATILQYTSQPVPEVVATLTVTDPPPTINVSTLTVTEMVTVAGPPSVRVEITTITVSQSKLRVCLSGSTTVSGTPTATPDTVGNNTSTVISDPPSSSASLFTTAETPTFPNSFGNNTSTIISDLSSSATSLPTTLEIQAFSDSIGNNTSTVIPDFPPSPTPPTVVEMPIYPDSIGNNTGTVISDLPPSPTSPTIVETPIYPDSVGSNTSTVISDLPPSPTSSSTTVEIPISPEITPTDPSYSTPSVNISAVTLPPLSCYFSPLALNNTFETPSDISAWSSYVFPFGTSASYPPSGALAPAHSGSRYLKMRMSGSVTIPGARMTVTRTISNICSGAEYEMSAWVRAPTLGGSTGGRCSAEFWGTEVVDGVAGNFRFVMGGVVIEDGVWRMIQGGWVQAVEAEQVQMRFQVQCGGSGERNVYMDDFVVEEME